MAASKLAARNVSTGGAWPSRGEVNPRRGSHPMGLKSFQKWKFFMVHSAALPLHQADQMRGSGGPNACGRPTSWKNACGAKNLAPARAARLRTWVRPGRLNIERGRCILAAGVPVAGARWV